VGLKRERKAKRRKKGRGEKRWRKGRRKEEEWGEKDEKKCRKAKKRGWKGRRRKGLMMKLKFLPEDLISLSPSLRLCR